MEFEICAGVRQGCVLSPRLFIAALQHHMLKWRQEICHLGIDFADGLPCLLDLRLADDILLFGTSAANVCSQLDCLIEHLASAGLLLNPEKTIVLTNTAQPPDVLTTAAGLELKVIGRVECHKWLGVLLCVNPSDRFTQDIQFHIQAATRSFFANRSLLCDRFVPITARLKLFNAVVSSVACFAACHRTPRQTHIQLMATSFRKLLRQVVGVPAGLDWSQPWHDILHEWNEKGLHYMRLAKIECWSVSCLKSYWQMAAWIATLPADRWVRRALAWEPPCSGRRGHPRNMWDSLLISFCRSRGIADWFAAARNSASWNSMEQDFVDFCCTR